MLPFTMYTALGSIYKVYIYLRRSLKIFCKFIILQNKSVIFLKMALIPNMVSFKLIVFQNQGPFCRTYTRSHYVHPLYILLPIYPCAFSCLMEARSSDVEEWHLHTLLKKNCVSILHNSTNL